MKITEVRVRRLESSGKMKAVVSVTLDGEFVVHDIKIIKGENGLFVAMPSRRGGDGEYRDIAHPINASMRKHLHEKVLSAYEEACASEES